MDIEKALIKAGLSEYQTKALISLIQCGEAKASEIAKLSNIPRAKIYTVLDQLVDLGLADKKPGRPIVYKAKKPNEILDRLRENLEFELKKKLEIVEKKREEMLRELSKLYCPKSEPKELVRVVRVGEPSEKKTKLLIREANNEINVISKVFEYYPKIKEEIMNAEKRGVKIRVLLLGKHILDERGRAVQEEIVKSIKEDLKSAEIKFSKDRLPLRGIIVDPSYDYTSGKAIFVVEDPRTPLYLRDAAVTENPSLVAGMKKYFDLIWRYESGD